MSPGARPGGCKPRIGAVLLAAGAASRLGGRPKALLELDGLPLVRRQLIALSAAGADELVVVLGHHAEIVSQALEGLCVTQVRNPHPDAGQVSSQRLGLAALRGSHEAVIVALADQPLLDAADIAALVAAFAKRPAGAAVIYPQVRQLRGNPVMFTAAVRDEILAAGADVGCRQWQAANPGATMPFVTDNPHYRLDIDTADDIARFERDTGLTLRWPRQLASG